MSQQKSPPSLVVDKAMLKQFINGHLEPDVEDQVAAYLENRPELLAKIAAISGDDFTKRLKDAKQRSIAPQSHAEPTALAAGIAKSANNDVRPEASAHGSRKPAHVEPAVRVEPVAERQQTQVAGVPNQAATTNQPIEFPGYEIVKELGRGGMGVVYLAKNNEMDRLEVLKVLSERLLNHPGAEQRFKQEIRAVSKLNHANIVTSYNFLRTQSQMAFAMEYVHGMDLHKFIYKQQILPVGLACSLARQIAAGLQHAHDKGLVHRDIKPSNAMLYKSDGQLLVKILDFGLAKATSEKTTSGLTQDGTMLGTPEYMAPEQMLNAAKADIRADIYSLGCTLYHMLAGNAPFGGTQGEIMMAHAQKDAVMVNLVRPHVPVELAAIIAKMMAKDPGKRFQTPSQVNAALLSFVNHPKVTADLDDASVRSAANTVQERNIYEQDTSVEIVQPISVAVPSIEPASLPNQFADLVIKPHNGMVPNAKRRQRTMPQLKKIGRLPLVGAAFLGIIGIVLGVLTVRTPDGTIEFQQLPADADVIVDGNKVTVQWDGNKEKAIVSVKPGTRNVEVQRAGIKVEGTLVTVSSGEEFHWIVRVPEPKPTPPKSDATTLPGATFTNSIGMKLNLIPAGTFMMGSPTSEKDRDGDETQHQVTISKPFYMGTTEATQGQWESVMGTTPWKGQQFVKVGSNVTATYVNWNDAAEFCKVLGAREGKAYSLPTEAQCEYACRGGTTTAYSFGADGSNLSDYGWWGGFAGDGNAKSEQYAHEVGTKRANGFGLFDMHGNSWEWCSDWMADYGVGSVTDPQGPPTGSYRVFRGGSWDSNARDCRSADRLINSPDFRYSSLGFRVVISDIEKPKPDQSSPPKIELKQAESEKSFTNSIGMKLNLIPAGMFMMGSPESEKGRKADETQHQVTISKPFYVGTTEVTQGQWQSVMGTTPWQGQQHVNEGINFATTYVSWDDAMEFCKKLSAKVGKTYHLPTEAQWEYACRGGATTAYSFGADESNLSDYGWWGGGAGVGNAKSEQYAHEVGMKIANGFGLFDMHGNVFEWCVDWQADYPTGSVTDFQGPATGSRHVFRGGGWYGDARHYRSAYRSLNTPDDPGNNLGFRVVISDIEKPKPDQSSLPKIEPKQAESEKSITNSIGMKLNLIPAGTFMMGSPESEKGRKADETQHQVTISKPFYIGTTEVTQGQWQSVMGTTPWQGQQHVNEGINFAATYVSWDDAMEFCKKLSAKVGKTYHLPTEAQWEYACRGGATTAYSFGADESNLSAYGWWGGFEENGNAKSEHYAHEVGMKRANRFGLFDMHGNVWEWCLDWQTGYPTGSVTDPQSPATGSSRVNRGGGWDSLAWHCKSAHRNSYAPDFRDHYLGFRVALSETEPYKPDRDAPPMTAPVPTEPKAVATLNSITNSIGMKLNLIPAGTFTMGSPESEKKRHTINETQHQVTISNPFYLGTTEVTQGQWESVMGTMPWRDQIPSKARQRKEFVKEGPNFPAAYVSGDDVIAFCKKLSEKENKSYRLPTEAQWEYSCRAGSATAYSFGDDEKSLSDYAWWGGNVISEQYAHEVGKKRANSFGLFDMHGNVFEYSSDPETSSVRVMRGGSWFYEAGDCRSANRSRSGGANWRAWDLGFRVAISL